MVLVPYRKFRICGIIFFEGPDNQGYAVILNVMAAGGHESRFTNTHISIKSFLFNNPLMVNRHTGDFYDPLNCQYKSVLISEVC